MAACLVDQLICSTPHQKIGMVIVYIHKGVYYICIQHFYTAATAIAPQGKHVLQYKFLQLSNLPCQQIHHTLKQTKHTELGMEGFHIHPLKSSTRARCKAELKLTLAYLAKVDDMQIRTPATKNLLGKPMQSTNTKNCDSQKRRARQYTGRASTE